MEWNDKVNKMGNGMFGVRVMAIVDYSRSHALYKDMTCSIYKPGDMKAHLHENGLYKIHIEHEWVRYRG